MKRLLTVLCALLAMQSADALVVSVNGEGEVPAEGLNMLVTEGEDDILSGRYTMALEGDLFTTAGQIQVRITRSDDGLEDEFCCGNNCTAGNRLTEDVKVFDVSGVVHWYAHYTPAEGADETIVYEFSDGEETLSLRVNYRYTADAVGQVMIDSRHARGEKVLKDGQVLVTHDGRTFTTAGTLVNECK